MALAETRLEFIIPKELIVKFDVKRLLTRFSKNGNEICGPSCRNIIVEAVQFRFLPRIMDFYALKNHC